MIPLCLRLTNFLSYRQATLDFRGLHTACVCGANGAGKSSLLEAITWVLWGQSRAALGDDVIHQGADEVLVEFILVSQGQLYRVLRRRPRAQSAMLEFQIGHLPSPTAVPHSTTAVPTQTVPNPTAHNPIAHNPTATSPDDGTAWHHLDLDQLTFRSITTKGLRNTQQQIIQTLKLDYDTFVNSAYLRQGRADEFMLKRPTERKQVLASLLNLDQYDGLAERAREQAREAKAQAKALELNCSHLLDQLSQAPVVEAELEAVTATLAALQQDQAQDQARQVRLTALQQQRQDWQQQLAFAQQQCDRLQQAQADLQQQEYEHQQEQQGLQALLEQAEQIEQEYHHWQQLQQQDEQLAEAAEQHRCLAAQRDGLQEQLDQQTAHQSHALTQLQMQRETLTQQQEELQKTLKQATTVAEARKKLVEARSRLKHLEQQEAEAIPLLHQQQKLVNQLEQLQSHQQSQLQRQLQQLQQQEGELQVTLQQQPALTVELETIGQQIHYLEQRRQRQQQLQEKGLERRGLLERLMIHRQEYEAQITKLDEKRQPLEHPEAPCPLCDRPLDEQHRQEIQQQQDSDRQDILDLLTVVQGQSSAAQREIEILRDEYHAIERELTGYCGFLERRAQLQQKLKDMQRQQEQLSQVQADLVCLQQQLQEHDSHGANLQQELSQLETCLAALDYDEYNHALARGEVERWRWADMKRGEIKQAEKRQDQLAEQLEQLNAQESQLLAQTAEQQQDQAWQDYQQLQQQLEALNYDPSYHNELRQSLRDSQSAQLNHQALRHAQEQQPQALSRQQKLQQQRQELEQDLAAQKQSSHKLTQQLETSPDVSEELLALAEQILHRRHRLDQLLAEQGRLQQRQQQLATLQHQQQQQQQQIQCYRHQQRIHQELAQAFGKNGIQALMIETVLPQLEQLTNRTLAQLSDHQLHVQFITQKITKTAKTKINNQSNKKHSTPLLLDTLDICIADSRGTRPYETFSGGEAFRVNFAIRLALARLLAQRSGTALQLLIVDEGFGSQDREGCDRLVAAINAIAPEFSCILTITHMPQFQAAFQARIEIVKTAEGSQLLFSG